MEQDHIKLLTVNKAPERAKLLIGRVVEALSPTYDIHHVDNCQSIEEVTEKATRHQPNLMISASMWTPQEAEQIHAIARKVVPEVKTHAIPTGLQVERGPDAIVEYLIAVVPQVVSA